MSPQSMKALNYAGPFTVCVEDVDVPKLEHPDDAIVRVTTVGDSIITRFQSLTLPGGHLWF